MGEFLDKLEPQLLWYHFEILCNTPRPSKKEEKIIHYLETFAKKYNIEYKKDEFGNVLMMKPATPGYEDRRTIMLQGHIDMVCEKNRDIEHDFDNDPIQPYIDGDWVKAKGTTLGADNGIGVAASLAVARSTNLEHGPLEFLFTVDEETGLTGAANLAPGFSSADIMLNLDSEEDGAFYIGCSGGKNTYGDFEFALEPVPADSVAFEISVLGLKGGHSGLEINDGKGNAIKLLTRLLWNAEKNFTFGLAKIEGGSKHNAIPREAFAVVTVPNAEKAKFVEFVNANNLVFKSEYATVEPDLKVSSVVSTLPANTFKKAEVRTFLNCLYAMPHGVYKMSPDIPGLVETSTNLATIFIDGAKVNVGTSQRSSVASEIQDIADKVATVFELAGAVITSGDGYPGWKPNIKSPILAAAKKVYVDSYGVVPDIKAIHAGLECGILGEKFPGLDMLSFGPTIVSPHSPDEKVQISTVSKFWELLLNILKNAPQK